MPGKGTALEWGDEWTARSSALGVVASYSMKVFELDLQPEVCGLRD